MFNRIKKIFYRSKSDSPFSVQTESSRSADEIVIDTRLGRFRLENFAMGGVCEVKKGIPLDNQDCTLAVKMIREKWYENPAVRKQFSQESQIVKELKHPMLPHYVSRGIANGKPFYAYKLIDGIPLIRLWQDQELLHPKLMRQLAPEMVKQLLEQLAYLHNPPRTIIHGDISSENIILDKTRQLHLVDFGCAHFQSIADKDSFQWLAKPSFISPEQARGQAWDHRSDLYQAGILFYELISGKRWNRGENKREKVLYAASSTAIHNNFLLEYTDANTSKLIAHMLDPNPDTRLPSAARGVKLIEALLMIQEKNKEKNQI